MFAQKEDSDSANLGSNPSPPTKKERVPSGALSFLVGDRGCEAVRQNRLERFWTVERSDAARRARARDGPSQS